MKKELVKSILSHFMALVGGFIIGRITKTAPMREIATNADASDADMKAAAMHFAKIVFTALIEGTRMADAGMLPEELASMRKNVVDGVMADFSRDPRIPTIAHPLLKSFLEWLFDPDQPPDAISPKALYLTSDFGDYLSKLASERAVSEPQLLQDAREVIDLLKPVLRKWEAEGRDETCVRPLRHFIGAMAVIV